MNLEKYKEIINTLEISVPNYETEKNTYVSVDYNDETIIFNIVNKNIELPINMKNVLIQGDKLSRKLHFVMDRHFDGVDLNGKQFFVKYKNAKNENGIAGIDNFTCVDNSIEFDFWVTPEITVLFGGVLIQIEIIDENEMGDVIYRYQTTGIQLYVEKTIIPDGDVSSVDYYLDIKFLNAYPEDTDINISTTLPPIKIDNRSIIMPALDNIAVTNDTRSKVITFEMRRYMDYIDLSEKTIVIKYLLSNDTGDRTFICNKRVTDTTIKFDWMIDSKVTSISGKVSFSIEFLGYNEKNEFYCMNTLPSYIFVSEGLNVDNFIENPSASWIQSWNIQADSYLKNFLKYTTIVNENLEKVIENTSKCMDILALVTSYAVDCKNNADISWNQADRSDQACTASKEYKDSIEITKLDFDEKYTNFINQLLLVRLKSEFIEKTDLSAALVSLIDNKSPSIHTHNVAEIEDARSNKIAITESDLCSPLANKINKITSGDGGVSLSGVQINDIIESFSETWSSKNIANKISSATSNVIHSDGNKVLSANDFTSYYRKKLDSIDENANYFDIQQLVGTSISIFSQDNTHLLTTINEKDIWDDKYTKSEIDSIVNGISTGLLWQASVSNFEDISSFYPNPKENWAVGVDNGDSYIFNGTSWVKFGSSITPLVTALINGLMSAKDKIKLDAIQEGANNYILPQLYTTDIKDNLGKVMMTVLERDKLKNIESSTLSILENYRENSKKINESDLDSLFLNKLQNASGIVVNDEIVSETKTFSSAKIELLLLDLQSFINNSLVTENDVDSWF